VSQPGAVLVEFLGLPGVGKSELSRRVADRFTKGAGTVDQPSYVLAHDMGKAERRLWKSVHVLREFLSHPVASIAAIRAISATRQRSRRTRWKLIFNWLLVVDLARQARRHPGLHLLDQGVLQAMWSVALDDDSDAALALLRVKATRLALPDIVVLVEADLATVQQRLGSRPHGDSRLDREPGRMPELLSRGEALLQRIRVAVGQLDRARIISVRNDADTDLQDLTSTVVQALAAGHGGA